ncbi:unnamed protein product [Macrosiphum euphorbiae]|uniref:Uncharacterized protein n=1 Tax=Macrosiphum euphorbiae TaxID=13131 RepID=A0AAV0X1B8_9HEMI|nr:unnamed protein product [Macrosiphum euphorbiae]
MRANDSSATVSGVSASTKYTTPNRLLVASNENVSKINERMKILETTGGLELCTSWPSNNFRPMTKMIGIEHHPIVEDCYSKMTQPTRKALIKQVLVVHNSFTTNYRDHTNSIITYKVSNTYEIMVISL